MELLRENSNRSVHLIKGLKNRCLFALYEDYFGEILNAMSVFRNGWS